MKTPAFLIFSLFLVFSPAPARAEDGYRLWLRYERISNDALRSRYIGQLGFLHTEGTSEVIDAARRELLTGLRGMLGITVPGRGNAGQAGLYLGIAGTSPDIDPFLTEDERSRLRPEGYIIRRSGKRLVITALDEKGLLYGAFRFLRVLQLHESLDDLEILENPGIKYRLLNHWDNLDGTVERGYAGFSIWNWHQLPTYLDPRYTDYARANASLGINGAVVTNVNANALIFRKDYIAKAAALANLLRPYGIRLYLTARFSAPIEQGGLPTADPLNEEVIRWWREKVAGLYEAIPDFGGFLVKANSEGQPGPQDYGRTHAQGANLLAEALEPYGGIVMWRAFVYSASAPRDRAMEAYDEFVPLDGKFRENVVLQVKNGPVDFQPREPVHPLFGAMPKTPLMMEFQITKEYLGQGTHLVGLAPLFSDVLNADTFHGPGTPVASIVDGSAEKHDFSGMAGVSNIGNARNWTGHHFNQADWYAFGRLAWNPAELPVDIYGDWAKMTFTHEPAAVSVIKKLLMTSHEACVNYMTPLGLHHIMAAGHHYGPGPWVDQMSRPDWTSVYYHRADKKGLGFDRTGSGSNALSQYAPGFSSQYEDMDTCPLEFLLWFHHVPWDHTLSTGKTLWRELCERYTSGAARVSEFKRQWEGIRQSIDKERYEEVLMHLNIQEREARWWRDACLAYFRTFSGMEIPEALGQPEHGLEYYEALSYPYAPGIRPKW